MATRNTCVMTFITALGKKKNITINEPRPSLHSSNITMASSMLIGANPFDGTVGSLTELDKAVTVSETKTVLF